MYVWVGNLSLRSFYLLLLYFINHRYLPVVILITATTVTKKAEMKPWCSNWWLLKLKWWPWWLGLWQFRNQQQPPPPPPPQVDRLTRLLRLKPNKFSMATEPIMADDWLHVVHDNFVTCECTDGEVHSTSAGRTCRKMVGNFWRGFPQCPHFFWGHEPEAGRV